MSSITRTIRRRVRKNMGLPVKTDEERLNWEQELQRRSVECLNSRIPSNFSKSKQKK